MVSNNPYARFNQPELDDCNLYLPLWQLARASSAAPFYYEPETITFGRSNQYEFVFVDGALTGFLNPSFKGYQYVTNGAYGINWPASEQQLTIVSVGTGDTRNKRLDETEDDINILSSVAKVPEAMMYATSREQDLLCRTFGRCITGDPIDLEVGDMKDASFSLEQRLFRYHRINPSLTEKGLADLGCGHINHEDITSVDCVEYIEQLQEAGRAMSSHLIETVSDSI